MDDRRTFLDVFDQPMWRDWTVWLGGAAVAAVWAPILVEAPAKPLDGYHLTATVVELAWSGILQFGLMAGIPATIRRRLRRRHQGRV